MKKKAKEPAEKTIDQQCEPREANFEGLREILFEELNLLREGKISNGRARITSQLARRIIEAATLDLYAQGLLANGGGVKRLMSNNIQG